MYDESAFLRHLPLCLKDVRKEPKMIEEIWRLPRVVATIGMGRSWIYLAVQEGRFPAPIRIGSRAIGWKRSGIQAWLDSCQQRAL